SDRSISSNNAALCSIRALVFVTDGSLYGLELVYERVSWLVFWLCLKLRCQDRSETFRTVRVGLFVCKYLDCVLTQIDGGIKFSTSAFRKVCPFGNFNLKVLNLQVECGKLGLKF